MARATHTLRALVGFAVLRGALGELARKPVPEHEVNLDLPPEERFSKILTTYNSSVWAFYKSLDNVVIRKTLRWLSEKRGPEPDELQREIVAGSKLMNVPLYGLSSIQMLYELGDLEIPLGPNITIPWKGACTGIIAINKQDGTVYHARNQDFAPAKYLQPLLYTGVFTKGGKELFRAQMLAGYFMPLTALVKGPNGFSYETNTRYMDKSAGLSTFWHNLFSAKRPLNGWSIRKALETMTSYEDFVHYMSTVPLVAPMYNIIGGVKKGTILARDPDSLAHTMTLGQTNYQCRDDYIIVTNFDYFFHDFREWFDPTGGKGIGHPRRPAAQKILNSSAVLTQEVLWTAINDFEVMAKDTIYQVMINVERGLFNASLPACTECAMLTMGSAGQSVIV